MLADSTGGVDWYFNGLLVFATGASSPIHPQRPPEHSVTLG